MQNRDINLLGFIVGAAGFGYAIYTTHKMNKICKKIDSSLDEMTETMDIDIPTAMIDQAVNMAIDREATKVVSLAADRAVREIKMDIHGQIKTEVNVAYSDIRKQVSDRVACEVAHIDTAKLRKDVITKAEEKIIEKFDGNLDDITEKYNRELQSISSIYSSIANSMTPHINKETVLRIG